MRYNLVNNVGYLLVHCVAAVFAVDSTGLIYTKFKLDREQTSTYTLSIVATDMGDVNGERRLNDSANVTVTLTDENDNSPTFVSVTYAIEVYEVRTPGIVIICE